jgi:hypothetical protein
MEIWKKAKDFEENYVVSSYGRVMNYKTEKILKLNPHHNRGYLKVGLRKNGKQYTINVHRLIARTFIPNPKNKREVNHKDTNKSNNRVNNLEWMTGKENTRHSIRKGLKKTKLTYRIAEQIRKEYIPNVITQNDLALKYGVKKCTIRDIVGHRTWREDY